jgi:hypothetical protein
MPPDVSAQKIFKMSPAVIILVVVIVITLLGLLFMKMSGNGVQVPDGTTKSATEATPVVSSTTDSLGGQIYEKAQNPLDGKIETQVPVSNPINDAYKNPFE